VVAFVAVTVSVEAFPWEMVVGLATMVTVGGPLVPTVTVTVAVAVVSFVAVAVAVYVVVADGVTFCVPPVDVIV
jgi:hypothetical protein